MSQEKEMKERLNTIRKKLILNLVINWLVPLILVIILRHYVNDATALAVAGAIPVIRTLTFLLWRHKVEWIGAFSVISFITAYVVSIMTGGSPLPLKLYHPIVTGIIGLILLGSVVIKKPLLLIILRILKFGGAERFDNPDSQKRFALVTTLLGLILLIDAIIHIIMAFALPTVAYLSMSRVITLIIVLVLVGIRLVARRN